MAKHQQVKVFYFQYQEEIEVDKGMKDILQLIWNQKIATSNSCQDNHGMIWIEFPNLDQFSRLVQKAHTFNLEHGDKYEYDTLKNFIESQCSISLNIDDNGYYLGDLDEYISGPKISLCVSLRFDKELKDKFIEVWKQMLPF